jgi:hypothetical protein
VPIGLAEQRASSARVAKPVRVAMAMAKAIKAMAKEMAKAMAVAIGQVPEAGVAEARTKGCTQPGHRNN